MVPVACLMHWYISMMYVVPVLAVCGWCWLKTRRSSRARGENAGTAQAAQSRPTAGLPT
jgi:hypothetical protein